MKYTYNTTGTCSRTIEIEIEDDKLMSLNFVGGCNGNLKGISALCRGMKVDDIIDKLEGIKCGFKNTSCPDQLANALMDYKKKFDL